MLIKASRILDAVKAIQALDAMEKTLDVGSSVRVTLYRNGSRIRNEGEALEKAKADIQKLSREKQLEALDITDDLEREKALLDVQAYNAAENRAINDQEVDIIIKKIKLSALALKKNTEIPLTALIALDFMIDDDDDTEDAKEGDDENPKVEPKSPAAPATA